jgi:3-oxoacyl-[acyl-carrier protein] reductase
MRLPKFDYLRPSSLEESAQLLKEYGSRARLAAGGTDLYPRMKSLLKNIPEKIRKRVISSEIPLGRMPEVEEISHAVRFIIENDYLNGRVIDIDGGLRL